MKMNKKLLYGLVLPLLAVVLVAAGLVSYLSNTIETDVEVSSPLTIITENTETGEVYGGQVFITQATVTNNINDTIYGIFKAIITNDLDNAICDDYQEITVDVIGGNSGEASGIPLMDLPNMDINEGHGCTDNGNITIIKIPVRYVSLETQSYNLNLKFAPNVEPATYNIESQIMII